MLKTIKEKLLSCKRYHESNAEQDAWYLLQKITGKTKSKLLIQKTINLTPTQKKTLTKWLKQITIDNKPIQYILETVPFCNITIKVKKPILIPRPETEYLCDLLIKKLNKVKNKKLRILDLCSGTGCIGLSIAKEFKNFHITCTDINPKAINLIKKNAELNNIKNVTIKKSDLYEELSGQNFDLIISNPPYITEKEWEKLDKNIILWEDKNALVSDKQGLYLIEKIIKKAPFFLKRNNLLIKYKIPQLIIEIGEKQGKKALKIINFEKNVKGLIEKDIQQKDRWIEFFYK